MNHIFNEVCFKTMERDELLDNIDLILTSPPNKNLKKIDQCYINWSIDLFKSFDKILKKNSCILYNLNYSKDPMFLFKLITEIVENTNFTVIDNIVIKNNSPIINNRSKNRLNKITDNIFVFCRKKEVKTFNTNKSVLSFSEKLDKPTSYSDIDDFIENPNELILELLNRYGIKDGLVYDPFVDLGLTIKGAIKFGMNYVGSELDIKKIEKINSEIHQIKFVNEEYYVEVETYDEDDDFWNV